MNAGTAPDAKFFTIGAVNDYSCDQGEILDYSSFQKVGCSVQLETEA